MNSLNTKINLGIISTYRTELMGLSAISILLCHAPANGVLFPNIFSKVLSMLVVGVDVFLFLSGVGLWYSLNSKFTDRDNRHAFSMGG